MDTRSTLPDNYTIHCTASNAVSKSEPVHVAIPLVFDGVSYTFVPTSNQVKYVMFGEKKFDFAHHLGEGTSSKAELFCHGDLSFVVKSPKRLVSDENAVTAPMGEIDFLKKAYPGTYYIHHATWYTVLHHRAAPASPYGQDVQATSYSISQTYFVLLPYIPGKRLRDIFATVKGEAELLEIYLAVAKELQRIHDLGIIHGDVKDDNILVDKDPVTKQIKVTFIDFEWAYNITDPVLRATDASTQAQLKYWPKERAKDRGVDRRPAFNQDIFSLAWLINNAFSYRTSTVIYSECLLTFAMQGVDRDPNKRPSLRYLIDSIEARLYTLKNPRIIIIPDYFTAPSTPASAALSSTAMLMQKGIAPQESPAKQSSVKAILTKAILAEVDQNLRVLESKLKRVGEVVNLQALDIDTPTPPQAAAMLPYLDQESKDETKQEMKRESANAEMAPDGMPFMSPGYSRFLSI